MPPRSLTITFLLLLYCCGMTHAQVIMGFEAGPDFPRLTNAIQGYNASGHFVDQNSQLNIRFSGGLFFDFPLDKNDRFTIRSGVRYLGAGGRTPQLSGFPQNVGYFHINENAPPTRYSLDYIGLPVQLLYSRPLSFGKPWIGAGFVPAILPNYGSKVYEEEPPLAIGGDNSGTTLFDLAFIVTAGFTLRSGVSVGIDYELSLVDINDYSSPKNVRNSIWGIHIGYAWSLRGTAHRKN